MHYLFLYHHLHSLGPTCLSSDRKSLQTSKEYLLSLDKLASPNSTRLVTSRHDTFDVSSASRRACRAVLFDKLDTAKMHSLDTSNVSCRVET